MLTGSDVKTMIRLPSYAMYARMEELTPILGQATAGVAPDQRAIHRRIDRRHRAGIPDEALAPGEELSEPPSDEEVDRMGVER